MDMLESGKNFEEMLWKFTVMTSPCGLWVGDFWDGRFHLDIPIRDQSIQCTQSQETLNMH